MLKVCICTKHAIKAFEFNFLSNLNYACRILYWYIEYIGFGSSSFGLSLLFGFYLGRFANGMLLTEF